MPLPTSSKSSSTSTTAGQRLRRSLFRLGLGAGPSILQQQHDDNKNEEEEDPHHPLVPIDTAPSDEQHDDDDDGWKDAAEHTSSSAAPAIVSQKEMEQWGLFNTSSSRSGKDTDHEVVWNGLDEDTSIGIIPDTCSSTSNNDSPQDPVLSTSNTFIDIRQNLTSSIMILQEDHDRFMLEEDDSNFIQGQHHKQDESRLLFATTPEQDHENYNYFEKMNDFQMVQQQHQTETMANQENQTTSATTVAEMDKIERVSSSHLIPVKVNGLDTSSTEKPQDNTDESSSGGMENSNSVITTTSNRLYQKTVTAMASSSNWSPLAHRRSPSASPRKSRMELSEPTMNLVSVVLLPLEQHDTNSPDHRGTAACAEHDRSHRHAAAKVTESNYDQDGARTPNVDEKSASSPSDPLPLLSIQSSSSSTNSGSALAQLRRALEEARSSSSDDDDHVGASIPPNMLRPETTDVSEKWRYSPTRAGGVPVMAINTERSLLSSGSSGSSSALSEEPRPTQSDIYRSCAGVTPKSNPFLVPSLTTKSAASSSLMFSYSSNTDSTSVPEAPPPATATSSTSSRTTTTTKLLAHWKEDKKHAAIFRSPKIGGTTLAKGAPVTTTAYGKTAIPQSFSRTASSSSSSSSWATEMMLVELQSSTTEQGMEIVMENEEQQSPSQQLYYHPDEEHVLNEESVEVVIMEASQPIAIGDDPENSVLEFNPKEDKHDTNSTTTECNNRPKENLVTAVIPQSTKSTRSQNDSDKVLANVQPEMALSLPLNSVCEANSSALTTKESCITPESDAARIQVFKPKVDALNKPGLLNSNHPVATTTDAAPLKLQKETSFLKQTRAQKIDSVQPTADQPKAQEDNAASRAKENGLAPQNRPNIENISLEKKDPYEWAYAVWRRRGLLDDRRQLTHSRSTVPLSLAPHTQESRQVFPVRASRHSLPALSVTAPRKQMDQENFRSVMNKWKAKSESIPEAGPKPVSEEAKPAPAAPHVLHFPSVANSRAPECGRIENNAHHHIAKSITLVTIEKAVEICPIKVNDEDKNESESNGTCQNVEAAPSKFSTNLVPAPIQSKAVMTVERNPAASIPVEIQEPTLSPVTKVPQSQAWKLKWGSHLSSKERKRRESMPAAVSSKKTFHTVPKSHSDYMSAVHDFLKTSPQPTKDAISVAAAPTIPDQTAFRQSQPSPRHRHQHSNESSVFSPFLPPPTQDTEHVQRTKLESKSEDCVQVGEPNENIALSPPASATVRCTDNTKGEMNLPPCSIQRCNSNVSSQGSNLSRDSFGADSMAVVAPMHVQKSKPSCADILPAADPRAFCSPRESLRVKDLTMEIKRQISPNKQPACSSTTLAETMISPEGKTVMKKLEKVKADTSPMVGAHSERPWRHDRLIGRVKSMTEEHPQSPTSCQCKCSDSLFSGNDEMIKFFLPLTGTACTCGNSQPGLKNQSDPTSLVNILRSWQVEFLGSFGIYRGEDLVKANHRSASALASALRHYRKKMGMTPFRTKSCVTALQIWSKTSKAFVRSIRNQKDAHTLPHDLRAPNNLYLLSSILDSVPDTSATSVALSGSPMGLSPTSSGSNLR